VTSFNDNNKRTYKKIKSYSIIYIS
jgi:hypothetical protein